MTTTATRRLSMAVLALGCVLATAAPAGAAENGILNAVAYADLPAGTAVSVRPLDNSDENLALQGIFESELKSRGFIVSQNAPVVLNFETSGDVGAWTEGDRRTIIELQARAGCDNCDDAKVRLNLFDSRSGGILNQGSDDRTNIVTPSSYRIDATIDDSRDGKRLWQAWAIVRPKEVEGRELTKQLVPVVVKAVGKTVRQSTFSLSTP